VYLPHLRQAVYRNLIAVDEIIDAATSKDVAWVEATIDDFNSDVHREVLLANDRLRAFFDPERGGMLYELDVREAGANVLATFARRPEPYHLSNDRRSPVGQPQSPPLQSPPSDRSSPLVYDAYPRKSLLDHFFDTPPSLAALVAGRVAPCRFVQGRYQRKLRRNSQRVELVLTRTGSVAGSQVTVTKTIALAAESSELDIQYELEGLPPGKTHFAVEFNVASLGSEDHSPTICDAHGSPVGDLSQELDLGSRGEFVIADSLRGIQWSLRTSRDARYWTWPIRTLSRCPQGQQWIQQSTVVLPHWTVTPDARGRWQVNLTLNIAALTPASA
jgi:alpha-amylase